MREYDDHSVHEHRDQSPKSVRCAVITVSDSRTLAEDRSGDAVVNALQSAGHEVASRSIVPDSPTRIRAELDRCVASQDIEAVLITGGTGIASRDQTPDTIKGLFTKELPGYGELFRMLSYNEIGAAAMLSRATGGLIASTPVLLMPGSTGAVRLAMEKLILPELGHLVDQIRR